MNVYICIYAGLDQRILKEASRHVQLRNTVTYNMTLGSCAKGSAWLKALHLFNEASVLKSWPGKLYKETVLSFFSIFGIKPVHPSTIHDVLIWINLYQFDFFWWYLHIVFGSCIFSEFQNDGAPLSLQLLFTVSYPSWFRLLNQMLWHMVLSLHVVGGSNHWCS